MSDLRDDFSLCEEAPTPHTGRSLQGGADKAKWKISRKDDIVQFQKRSNIPTSLEDLS